jgi:hypothetical protein
MVFFAREMNAFLGKIGAQGMRQISLTCGNLSSSEGGNAKQKAELSLHCFVSVPPLNPWLRTKEKGRARIKHSGLH